MLPINLNSAFQLFNVQNLLTDQQQQQQLLLLQQQTQLSFEQQIQQQLKVLQQQQSSSQQLPIVPAASVPTVQQQATLLPVQKQPQNHSLDLEAFNQNLFYQAVFAGKDLENYLDSVVKRKNKLEQLQDFFVGKDAANFIKLVGNITLASLQRAMESIDNRIIGELAENPMKIILKENVWKQVTQIIARRQFEFRERVAENYYKELASMLIFKPEVTEIIFTVFKDSQTQSSITLGDLQTFYTMLQSSSHDNSTMIESSQTSPKPSAAASQKMNEIYARLSFFQFGGSSNSTIQRSGFCCSLEQSIGMLSQYFEKQNTIVNFIKRSSKSKLNFKEDQLLQSYLRVMGDFKQTNMKNFQLSLAADIFDKAESLDISVFTNKVSGFHVKSSTKILFTLFELIHIELDLVHQEEFISFFLNNLNFNSESQYQSSLVSPSLGSQQQQSPTQNPSEKQNYYLKTIDKLLNKCVFNGDEKCDCKKCQCIRRNRNSAKESQKKKREALQQIGPLLEKQDQLEKRCQELESENAILRKLLTEMVAKGVNDSSVQEIFQPISKIIAYRLKEEDEESANSQEALVGSNPSKKVCPNNRSVSSTVESIESLELDNENRSNQQNQVEI